MPNLFIVGAAKAGTTALYDYLTQHPHVFLSRVKEPMFFSREENYARGID
jgi:Sulfotransferase family